MTRLHITNGDSTSSTLDACNVPGDSLPWRDVLHDGPVPGGKTTAELARDSRRVPGNALFMILNVDTVLRSFTERDELVAASATYDEVTLWFEHDLYDQLQLLQILDWYRHHPLANDKLTLICIDRFNGIDKFYGLGQLNPAQLASLDPTRVVVSEEQLELGARGWRAFTDRDPTALLALINSDTQALPFLAPALLRFIEDYPGRDDGLSRSQRQVLTLVAAGTDQPGALFSAHQEKETAPYMGDWSYFRILEDLVNADTPALSPEATERFAYRHEQTGRDTFLKSRLEITEFGQALLSGDADWVHENGIDTWYGGVHLEGDPDWRYDCRRRTIVARNH